MRYLKAPAFLLAILILVSLFPAYALAAPEASPEIETVINIYHTNDVHGHALGNESSIGYARFKTYVKEDTADGKLIVDAGDAFSGSAFTNLSEGESISQIMNSVGYNAYVPGSHDFEYGTDRLLELVEESGTDGLALNLLKDGQPLFPAYRIFQKNGVKIGVIGIVSSDVPAVNDPNQLSGLTFLDKNDTIFAAQEAVAALQAENVNAIVALTHLGTSDTSTLSSIDIATSVSGIDLIIDGKSHDEYENGFNSYTGYIAGVTPPIAQAGKYFESFGVATLNFDDENNLLSISDKLIDYETAAKSAPDKKTAAIITDFTQAQQPILEKRIASTPVLLNGESEYVRTGSSNFGILATTAMMESTGADIAILNSGSILSSVPQGDITFGAMYNALDFDDYIVTTTVTGAELKELLNSQLIYQKSGFPQIAGFTIEAEQYLTESGAQAAAVTSLTRNGEPVRDDDTLTVAVLDYMYHGGDDYSFSAPLLKEYDTLFNTVVSYLNDTPQKKIESFSNMTNIMIWEETIDADSIISKLKLSVPSNINIFLNQPSTVPESVLYNLVGQNRDLVFFLQNERPYSFVFDGERIPSAMNASLVASVSQEVPEGKRTASSADREAIFVDLSKNQALPPDTLLNVYVGDVYQPGSLVYLYYYDLNRDILPLNTDGIKVDSSGNISFPVVGGTTYLVNSKLLNASTLFEAPTPSNPFLPGIAVVLVIFSAWVVFFLITKKGSQKNEK